jgi:hypothetical protein
MAIDIRATVTCSLGTLISGSISDDYIQGSGLIKTKGSVELSALITPAIGTVVTFSYVKGGVTRSIPRKLRVMSSFADPFRRTTKVELGCKLTYLSDLQEPVDWTAFDDPENAAYDEEDARIVTLPIYASSAMDKCLTELGITASSNPLTNKFSIPTFEFGGGYVSVLSDLLVSESYCGYLDTSEVLQVFNLDQDAGTGPVFTASDIVDLGPIGVGSLPGEAVTVSYSTLKLKDPDPDADEEDINWERSVSSSPVSVLINYGENESRVYTGVETTVDTTIYTTINDKEVPSKRIVEETRLNASVAGGLVQEYLENDLPFNSGSVQGRTEELFFYDDEGNEIGRQSLRYQSGLETYGSVGLPMVFSSGNFVVLPNPNNRYLVERVVTIFKRAANYTRTEIYTYGLWNLSIPGQQAIASARDSFSLASQVESYILRTLQGGLVLLDSSFDTRFTGSLDSQERPSAADRINSSYAKGGDPNNGWRTESTADLELAVGSATAQRRIELSMPYAPDDIFSGPSGGPFTSTPSDAPAKANRYGRVQNRLLLGNRNGINLQLAPEKLPAAPYAPLYVQASGLTALYRANGTSWAFDSNGIICSVDALFWAAVGGTGTFWFPVAPGITTLPTTPAIVDGTMTPTTVVLPYNETAIYNGILRTRLDVTKFDYSLTLLTVVPALVIRTSAVVRRVRLVNVPNAIAITTAAAAPTVSSGASVRSAAIAVSVATATPQVVSGASAQSPAASIAVLALTPDQAGKPKTIINVPATDSSITVLAPAVVSGGSVTVSAVTIAVAALTPISAGPETDPDFSSVSLLLHMDGSNGSTTFTDTSTTAHTITAFGDAQVTTTSPKFGTGALLLDGTGDYLSAPSDSSLTFGTGDFTIEAWVRLDSVSTRQYIFSQRDTGGFTLYLLADGRLSGLAPGSNSVVQASATMVVDTWHHVAFTRLGTSYNVWVDGVSSATSTFSGLSGASGTSYIGYRGSDTIELLDGRIDDLRITKGVCRYTGAFTPPTAAFPDQ